MRRLLVAVLIAVGFLAVDGSSASAQEVKTIPTSVVADCSRDVSSQVKSFVEGIPNGGTGKLQPLGCYIVNETIGFGKQNATLDGNGATLRRTKVFPCATPGGAQPHGIRISGGKGVTVRGLRFEVRDGTPYQYTACHAFEHAISVLESENTNLLDLAIDKPHGDCLYIRGAVGLTGRNVDCIQAQRQGIGFVKGTDATFDNFDMTGLRSGLDFEPNHVDQTILRVKLLNSAIAVSNLPVASQGRNAQIRDILIQGNEVSRGKGFVWGHQTPPDNNDCRARTGTRSNWRILDNRVSGTGSYGSSSLDPQGGGKIVLCGIDGFEITGNTISGPDAVALEATKGGAIKLNQFPGSGVAYKGQALQNAPQACGNVLSTGLDRLCDGTPPPPSSTTTTTRPPTSTAPPTTTTQPPSTQPPVTTQPVLTAEQIAIRDAYVALRKICAKATWC